MFIVLLKFSKNKGKVGQFMEGHKKWIKDGFDDGIFMLAGSLQPGLGGGIIAYGVSRDALEKRITQDPFVKENIVKAEVIEIEASVTDVRLDFLRD